MVHTSPSTPPFRLEHQAEALDHAGAKSSEAAEKLLAQAEEVASKARAALDKSEHLSRWVGGRLHADLLPRFEATILTGAPGL